MFDIGWTEITVILVIAIIVIGPKELPKVLRTVGQWVARAKAMTRDFRDHVDEMVRETEIEDLQKQAENIKTFDAKSIIDDTIDSDGNIREVLNFDDQNPIDLNDKADNQVTENNDTKVSKKNNDDPDSGLEEVDASIERPRGIDK
ncbi:MAG: twin-arginine translocase subunit TatB [Rhodospirillaceae bacterium]|nr:twin-arginine translocase subunit TatB [Rhodospirillaceae bacterium]OUT78365.1 MAG: twin-arginine translocase subunit TatB [Rhodospirillaceae bacterium TMED23]|tara:strand:- start:160 stop:597 length:438 start_codon:yes stop_codon:yes gene_type:complete